MLLFRLDVYIHDYLLKRKLHASAKAFMTEGKVASDPVGNIFYVQIKVWFPRKYILCFISFWTGLAQYFEYAAIDAPGGFLFEWWSVFWDIFIARTNEKHSEAAASYIEVCITFQIIAGATRFYKFILPFNLLEKSIREMRGEFIWIWHCVDF